MFETLLGSKLRAKVLGWLFSHPDERYFVRQLSGLLNEDSTNVSRELIRLEKSGILTGMKEGKQKYYRANDKCPIFNELKSLSAYMLKEVTISKNDANGLPIFYNIRVPSNKLADFCRKHHIQKLSFFGSVLRDDFRPDSDVDILVEFEPGYTPGFAIIAMEKELSGLLGRKVDLRTPGDLSRYFRDRVVREAKAIYARSDI